MIKTNFLLLFFSIFLFFSCEKPEISQENKKYFDLAKWIGKVAEASSSKQASVRKKTTIDGVAEEQTVARINWEAELALFSEADLNSPALADSYEITENTAEKTIIYESRNPSDKVQKMQIKGYPEKISEVSISFHERNYFYESRRQMVLEVGEGSFVRYRIEGWQKILFRNPMDYVVEMFFQENE